MLTSDVKRFFTLLLIKVAPTLVKKAGLVVTAFDYYRGPTQLFNDLQK